MKFKVFLKRFIFYLGAFIAVFSVTAGVKVGLFFITRSPEDTSEQNEITTDTNNNLSKVLNNIMQADNASLDLNLQLQTSEEGAPIKLQSNVALNMPQMTATASNENNSNVTGGLELALNGTVEFNSQLINYDINYLNGYIYAKFGDAFFKLETSNLSNDINKILNFGVLKKFGINVEIPDLSGINFDASMLTSLASSMTEVDIENGKELTINLFGYGNAVLLTDNDYVLKSISLEDLDFNGTKIVADIQADLNAEKTEIVEPTNKDEINDFSSLTKFLEIADKLLDKGYVSGKIDVDVLKNNLSFDYYVDFNDFNNLSVYLKTTIFDSDFVMQINSNKALVKLNDYKYYFDLPFDMQELLDSLNYYAQKFGIELPTSEIDSLVNNINVNNLNQLLELVGELKIDEQGARFSKNGISLELTTQNGEFDKIIASYKDLLSVNVTLNEEVNKIELDETEFKNLLDENVFNLLHEQVIQNKCLALKADMVINGTTVGALLKVDCSNQIKVQLIVDVLDKQISLTTIDDAVYLEVDNILKAKGSIEQIIQFAKNNQIIPQDNSSLDFDTIKNAILSLLQQSDVQFNITQEDGNIKTLKFVSDIVSGDVFVVPFEEINFVEQGEYQDVDDICSFVYNILNVINNKKLAFTLNARYGEYDIAGKVQYINGKVQAILQTQVLDKNLCLELDDDIIYINFDGLKLKTTINNLKDLAGSIKDCFGVDLTEIINSSNIDLDEILSNLNINFSDNGLKVTYDSIIATVDPKTLTITFNYDSTVEGQAMLIQEFNLDEKSGYINLDALNPLLKATLKTLKNRSISGKITVSIELFGEANLLDIDYAISIKNQKLIGYINTYFKGLKVSAYLDNKDIYLDIASMKVHFNVDSIDEIISWINQTFEQNISLNVSELISAEKLKEISFDIIKEVVNSNNNVLVTLNNDLQISVVYNEYIEQVNFIQGTKQAQLTCTNFEDISLDIHKEEFKEFDFYTTIIDNIYQLVKSKKYDINASVKTYSDNTLKNSIDTKVQLDISSLLNAYVDVLGLDEQITANYSNKMLYVRYGGVNGLKLSIEENALQEILSIACSALNIDTSSIPFLDEFLTKENIDTSNLSSIMPKVELSNPLQYLEYIEGFNLTDDCFVISLKTSKLTNVQTDKDSAIKLYYKDGKILSLELENLFTSKDSADYVCIAVTLNEFTSVASVDNADSYINISNSKDLIRAFVNTSNLSDWHINGKVKLSIKLGSAEINAATVSVDAKISLDENKKPTIQVLISGYPLIGLVNNKNTNGVGGTGLGAISIRERKILIAYKDGEIYLKTNDAKWGAYKELNRTTRITPSTMVNNLSYYIQYILGFTDSIQSKIDSAVQKSMSYEGETDYGNIIEEYTKSGNCHTIKINLKELAHNDDIGTLTLVLTTANNQSTNNKDYIYRLDLDLRILDDLMILETEQNSSTSGLYLTDIGSKLSLTDANDLFALHIANNFGLDGEYEKVGSDSWQQENSGTRTVKFILDGNVVSTQTGNIASALTKPTMTDIVNDDGETRKVYKFAGWFYDADFTSEFAYTTFPKYDTEVYAKYELVQTKYHAVVHFVTNKEVTQDDLTGFVGDNLVLPALSNIEIVQDENTSVLCEFVGWTDENGDIYSAQTFTSSTLTLYAKWNEVVTKTYRVQIISGGETVYDGKVASDSIFVFPSLPCFNENTLYYTNASFDESTKVTNFVVDGDKVWYAKNMYTVTILSDYTTKGGNAYQSTQTLYEQSTVSLPTYANYTIDSGTYYTEYNFIGWQVEGSTQTITNSAITPSKDVTYKAVWKVTDYVTITFNASGWTKPSWWVSSGSKKSLSTVSNTNGTNKVTIEKGAKLVFSNYVATCTYKYGVSYNFKTVAWADSVQNIYDSSYSGATEMTVNCHITLQPVWKHA